MPAFVGVTRAIDAAWEANESGPRPHLGASQIGKPCDRALVYSFRHAARKRTEGRMLRLWNRGHREEPSLIGSLRLIGFEVREYAQRLVLKTIGDLEVYCTKEWCEHLDENELDVTASDAHVQCAAEAGVKLKQWAFSDIGGHHGGSCDGFAMNPSTNLRQFPEVPPDTWFGNEYKTFNLKGHDALCEQKDVEKTKPEHFWQMQEYMHKIRLPWQPDTPIPFYLYLGINKNNDALYDEVVHRRQETGEKAVERARIAISARQLPPRLYSNPTNFTCKFCDYKGCCHFGDPLQKSCRTCKNGVAVTEGEGSLWSCALWNTIIPKTEVPKGCDSWSPMTD